MQVPDCMTLCITIDGDKRPFHTKGHYPILAGYTTSASGVAEPLYVVQAMLKSRSGSVSKYHCTVVPDGASNVTFADDAGEMYETKIFGVLVLRYNPSDEVLASSSEATEGAAIDSTGPLFWRVVELAKPEDKEEFDYVFGRACVSSDFQRWAFP